MSTPAAAFLGPARTEGYRPSVHGWTSWAWSSQVGLFSLYDVEDMRRDPQVRFALRVLWAPLGQVRWKVTADDAAVQHTADTTLRKVWQTSLPQLRRMLEYGNAAGETCYDVEEARRIVFSHIKELHPRDVEPLQQDGEL